MSISKPSPSIWSCTARNKAQLKLSISAPHLILSHQPDEPSKQLAATAAAANIISSKGHKLQGQELLQQQQPHNIQMQAYTLIYCFGCGWCCRPHQCQQQANVIKKHTKFK
jgi:hypothetical protein